MNGFLWTVSKSNDYLWLIRKKKKSLLCCQEASQDDDSSLAQKLAEAEELCKSWEEEFHQATQWLEERDRLVESLKEDKKQAEAHANELKTAFQDQACKMESTLQLQTTKRLEEHWNTNK